MIYLLSHNDHDSYAPNLIEGPEVEDWQAYCNSFLKEATDRAIKIEVERDSWVDWSDIVLQLVEILKEKGYKVVKPIEATFWGHIIDGEDEEANWYNKGITLPPSAKAKAVEHNKKIEERQMEEDKMREKS